VVTCAWRSAILLALLLDIWLGFAFGYFARHRIRTDGVWSQPVVSILLLFVGFVLVPSTMYLYLEHPAWSWLYLVDPERVTGLAVVSVLAACVGGVAGGYWGAGKLVRADRERVVLMVLGGLALLLLFVAFLLRGRLGAYGSYADYHHGRALPLSAVKLGYVLIALTTGLAASVSFVAWELVRDGRRAGSQMPQHK